MWDDKTGYEKFELKRYAYKKNSSGEYKTIFGDSVKKVNFWTKQEIEKGIIFESDIPVETRVLIDKYYSSDEISVGHRKVYFDIEVDIEDHLPNIELADNHITAISLYDDVANEYFVFILDLQNEINHVRYDNKEIIPFSNEEDLLIAFLQKWEEINPTIITGWNCDMFDVPYLYRRIKNTLGNNYAKKLSPIGIIYWNDHRRRYFIGGISCLDYLALYKHFTYSDQSSYTLDAISKFELDEGKIQYTGNLHTLMKNDINKFIEYSLVDTELVVKLDKKLNFIDLVVGICHKGHVPYEDIYYSSRWIEGTMLVFMKKIGLIAPNKNPKNRELMGGDDRFSGAYVKSPESGLYQWLFDLDFTSLYPSIVMTLNISPETKMGKIDGWNAHKHLNNKEVVYKVNITDKESNLNGNDIDDLFKKYDIGVSANGVLYRQDKKGIIPTILDEWFKDKDRYDKLMKQYGNKGDDEKSNYYKQRRTISKVMLNCFSYDTDIMTCDGIKNIKDVKIRDLVYSINPETLKVEIKPVMKVYEYDYNGNMIEIKNQHIDFLVTPNHKLLISKMGKYKYKSFEFIETNNIINDKVRYRFPSRAIFPERFCVKKTIKLSDYIFNENYILKNGFIRDNRLHTKFQPNEYNIENWIQFLGWYISDGSLYTSKEKIYENGMHRGVSYTICIAQQGKYRLSIYNLLTKMNIQGIYEDKKKYSFSSKIINNILENECGKGSENKKIPNWIFELDVKYLNILFNTLMKGDGHKRNDCYTTKSKTLAYQFIRLVHHIGKYAYIRDFDGCYRIQICHKRGLSPIIKHNHRRLVKNNGNKVYCVEVADNHTVLAGRNSKFNWIGQSIYGVLGLPVFRFYDIDGAEAVTTTGVSLIQFAEKMANHYYNTKIKNIIEIELEDNEIIKIPYNKEVEIVRNNKKIKILAKDIKKTDEFFDQI